MNAQFDCGYIYLEKMREMVLSGYYPDVIVSHTGWGCGLFAKYIYPNARVIGYCELWFNVCDGEYLGAEERYEMDKNQTLSMFKRNTTQAVELANCDEIVCATEWQRSLLPEKLADHAHVIHEGTDCDFFVRNDQWKAKDKKLITYATRGMEPMRGFPEFIGGSIKFIGENKNEFNIEIAGQDKVFYGKPVKTSYKKIAESMIEKNKVGENIIFRGRLNRNDYARLFKRSSIHCYLTKEFVPSWSLIDAMSSGCLLLVNRTASIREILPKDGVVWIDNLTQECVYKGLVRAQDLLNNDKEQVEDMRSKCRENAAKKFDRKGSITRWFDLINRKKK